MALLRSCQVFNVPVQSDKLHWQKCLPHENLVRWLTILIVLFVQVATFFTSATYLLNPTGVPSGAGTNLKVSCLSTFFGSTCTVSRYDSSAFVIASTVWSVYFLLFFYSQCHPRAQPFVKVGARAPVPYKVGPLGIPTQRVRDPYLRIGYSFEMWVRTKILFHFLDPSPLNHKFSAGERWKLYTSLTFCFSF